MIGRLLVFLWIAAWMVAAFVWAPLVPVLGETTRVLYFHIPAAWVTVLALSCSSKPLRRTSSRRVTTRQPLRSGPSRTRVDLQLLRRLTIRSQVPTARTSRAPRRSSGEDNP